MFTSAWNDPRGAWQCLGRHVYPIPRSSNKSSFWLSHCISISQHLLLKWVVFSVAFDNISSFNYLWMATISPGLHCLKERCCFKEGLTLLARCFNWSSPSVFTRYHVYLQMRLVMIKGVHHCESLPNWYVSCFTIDFNDSCSVESPGQEQPMLPDTNHVPQMQVSVAIKRSFFWEGRSLFISAERCWFEDPFPFLAAFFENAGRSPVPEA